MTRTQGDYAPLLALLDAEGVPWSFDERDGGTVLVEAVSPHLRLEWVYLPEHDWLTEGLTMDQVLAFTEKVALSSSVLSPGSSHGGRALGWTRVCATTKHDGEASRHGFEDIAGLRTVFRSEAIAMSDGLGALLAGC